MIYISCWIIMSLFTAGCWSKEVSQLQLAKATESVSNGSDILSSSSPLNAGTDGKAKGFRQKERPGGIRDFLPFFVSSKEDLASRLERSLSLDSPLSPICQKHCEKYLEVLTEPSEAMKPENRWAIKMFDAMGKIPDGILDGNFNAYGSYSSCLEVEAANFTGKYGLARLALSSGISASLGMCLPSSCTTQDMHALLLAILPAKAAAFSSGDIQIINPKTKTDSYDLTGIDVGFLSFVAALGILLFCGTCMDYWHQHLERDEEDLKVWEKLLMAFSVHSNVKTFLTIAKTSSKSEHLGCLDGIRFLSMSWILISHYFALTLIEGLPIKNLVKTLEQTFHQFWFQAIDNGFVAVDTFFGLSGCLLAYLTLKELDKRKGRINVPMFYAHRYLRLTGVYAFIIFLHASVMGAAYMGGPGNVSPTEATLGCRERSWRNLLYSTNFEYNAKSDGSTCLEQTWYLNCDMQMFLIVLPFILYPMWRWRFPGMVLAGLYVAASVAAPFALTILRDWPATPVLDELAEKSDYFKHNYINPLHRFSPYMVGIVAGYLLHHTKNREIKIPRVVNAACWTVALGTGIAVVFGLNIPTRIATTSTEVAATATSFSTAENALYGGFHRFAWGMAVAWVIFACSRGYGGWINEFLSWEAFQPLAKLTYVIYLMHITVNTLMVGYMRFEVTFTYYFATLQIFSLTAINILVAAVIHVAVELPWLKLEKLLFGLIAG